MGVDIDVIKLVQIPDDVKTVEQLDRWCSDNSYTYREFCSEHRNFPQEYVKELECDVFQWKLLFQRAGLVVEEFEFDSAEIFDGEERIQLHRKGTASTRTFLEDGVHDNGDTFSIRYSEIPAERGSLRFFVVPDKKEGHQRNGENNKFHDDGKWTTDIVVSSLEMLLDDWRKYFSDTDEQKENFKRNIIDNFVEGETIVIYC